MRKALHLALRGRYNSDSDALRDALLPNETPVTCRDGGDRENATDQGEAKGKQEGLFQRVDETGQDELVHLLVEHQLNIINSHDMAVSKKIGNGGYGVVYRAAWNGVPVAVKRLHNMHANSEHINDVAREIRILHEVRHPHIVLFLGIVVADGSVSLVTEYMPGGSVRQMLTARSDIPGSKLDSHSRHLILRDTALGMQHLHSHFKLIHRDLKAANILVDDAMNPTLAKVCDFGLSMHQERLGTLSMVGTPYCTAPEVLRGKSYDEKIDVYAYGIFCWFLWAEKMPFEGIQAVELGHRVAYFGFRPPVPSIPHVSEDAWLIDLMVSCWNDSARLRPSFEDIVQQVEASSQQAEGPPRILKEHDTNTLKLKLNPNPNGSFNSFFNC